MNPAGANAAKVWRIIAEGVALRVRVTPRSSRDAVGGTIDTRDGPAVKVAVRAIPAEGAANDAVERLVADWLDRPPSQVSVTSGGSARVKVVTITGPGSDLAAMIDRHLEGS